VSHVARITVVVIPAERAAPEPESMNTDQSTDSVVMDFGSRSHARSAGTTG
jgi:hypothetical protein